MNDGFAWWLIVLGIAIGVGLVWVFVVRLPRSESDVDQSEMPIEADWISRNIEGYGGVAPQPLVEEVLELHRQYLTTGPTPLPPAWRPSANGHEPEMGSGLRPEPEPAPEAETGPVAITAAKDDRPAEDPKPAEVGFPSNAPPTPEGDGVTDHR